MNLSHLNHVSDAQGVKLGIVAPDGRDGMLQHAREFHEAGIPFVFDPGQGLPMFNGEELDDFVRWRTMSPSTTTRRSCCRSAPARRSRAGQPGARR